MSRKIKLNNIKFAYLFKKYNRDFNNKKPININSLIEKYWFITEDIKNEKGEETTTLKVQTEIKDKINTENKIGSIGFQNGEQGTLTNYGKIHAEAIIGNGRTDSLGTTQSGQQGNTCPNFQIRRQAPGP